MANPLNREVGPRGLCPEKNKSIQKKGGLAFFFHKAAEVRRILAAPLFQPGEEFVIFAPIVDVLPVPPSVVSFLSTPSRTWKSTWVSPLVISGISACLLT